MTVFGIVDLETHDSTEAARENTRPAIIEVGLSVCTENYAIQKTVATLVHSIAPLTPTVAKLTGIVSPDLKVAPAFEYAYSCLVDAQAAYGITTWAHWGGDDWEILKQAARKAGLAWDLPQVALNLQSICWETMRRQGYRPTFGLRRVAKSFNVDIPTYHRAGPDTRMAALVMQKLHKDSANSAEGAYLREF